MIVSTAQLTDISTSITEPVTTAYGKLHMRVSITEDDSLIGNLITASREYIERHCNQSFAAHTYRADLWNFADCFELPMGPVQSVTHIKYYDTASPNVLQTLAASNYRLTNNVIRKAYGVSWPSIASRADAVQIQFVTGWKDQSSPQGTGADCPEAVRAAVLLLAASLYENREHETLYPGQLLQTRAFDMLLAPYRCYQ